MNAAARSGVPGTLLEPVSSILAIRFARLGDVALLLPALVRLRAMYPRARLALMTGTPCADLGRLCPQVDDVIAVDRLGMRDGARVRAVRDILSLVLRVRSRRFDLVIDFHSFRETNLLAWLSGARFRIGLKRSDRAYLPFCFNQEPVLEDKSLHVSEMFSRVVGGLPGAVPWSLASAGRLLAVPAGLAEEVRRRHFRTPPKAPVVAVYVGASVESRRWEPSRFASVADHAASQWGATTLILTGKTPEEEAIGRRVVESVAARGRVRVVAGLGIAELAAAIGLSRLLVSNDTGPMHLGPLMGVPTLGVFSRSLPDHYRPIGAGDRYIRKDTIHDVTADEVIRTMDEMWRPDGSSGARGVPGADRLSRSIR